MDPEGESRPVFELETTQAVPELPTGRNATFSSTSPQKGPLPIWPISPRSRSPAVPERGRLSLSDAIRDSKIMVEEVQAIRRRFELRIENYFWSRSASSKLLLKALDKLAGSLDSLRLELDVFSNPLLDDIETLDIDLGVLLHEADRIARAMSRAGSNLALLSRRPRNMRKSTMKDDLSPQMVDLAGNMNVLGRRMEILTRTITMARENSRARRAILARAFSERTLDQPSLTQL